MQIWRCADGPPGQAQKERDGGKGASSVFISSQGVPVGGPAIGTAGMSLPQLGTSLVPKGIAAIKRVQEQHSFHTKITGSAFSEHSYIFFFF